MTNKSGHYMRSPTSSTGASNSPLFCRRNIHFMGQEKSSYPIVTISRRGGERIRAGHVWVYRSDVVETANAAPGSIVLVQEQANAPSNRPADRSVRATQILSDKHVRPTRTVPARPARILGTALYSSASEIALRMISRGPVEGIHQLVRERIRAAIAYRQGFVRGPLRRHSFHASSHPGDGRGVAPRHLR